MFNVGDKVSINLVNRDPFTAVIVSQSFPQYVTSKPDKRYYYVKFDNPLEWIPGVFYNDGIYHISRITLILPNEKPKLKCVVKNGYIIWV